MMPCQKRMTSKDNGTSGELTGDTGICESGGGASPTSVFPPLGNQFNYDREESIKDTQKHPQKNGGYSTPPRGCGV